MFKVRINTNDKKKSNKQWKINDTCNNKLSFDAYAFQYYEFTLRLKTIYLTCVWNLNLNGKDKLFLNTRGMRIGYIKFGHFYTLLFTWLHDTIWIHDAFYKHDMQWEIGGFT